MYRLENSVQASNESVMDQDGYYSGAIFSLGSTLPSGGCLCLASRSHDLLIDG